MLGSIKTKRIDSFQNLGQLGFRERREKEKEKMTNTTTTMKQNLRYNEYYGLQDTFDRLYDLSSKGHKFNNLYELITSEQNIRLAYRTIKSNTGSATCGTDGLTIKDFKTKTSSQVINLVRGRLTNYKPDLVRRVEIPKPNGGTRPLGIPTMTDRLIQQCFKQVLEPICEAKFHPHSYGFRPNRSTEHALARMGFLINRGNFHYCVDVDIKGFFDNINHGKLLKQLWSLGIQDKKVLAIISKMLKAEVKGIGVQTKGTPQGGILSPLLANVVLNELDWWVSSQWETHPVRTGTVKNRYRTLEKSNLKNIFIIRYADDFKIMCRDYKTAQKTFIAVRNWITERLQLQISNEKSKITNLRKNYSEFLGLKLKATKKHRVSKKTGEKEMYHALESHICDKAAKNIYQNLRDNVKKLQSSQEHREVDKLNSIILGLHNYYKYATHVSKDFGIIDYHYRRTFYNRLKEHLVLTNINQTKGLIKEKYGSYNGKIYRLRGVPVFPLACVTNKHPICFTQEKCDYTVKGRLLVHKSLNQDITASLNYLLRYPVRDESIEFNDNRISKFSAQKGLCAITSMELELNNFDTHHIKPRSMGGTDEYKNLILVTPITHKLIHATKSETITKYLKHIKIDDKIIERLNKYRVKVGNDEIHLN